MNGNITFAIEQFEAACDEALATLGTHHAVQIINHRIERRQIIQELAPKENHGGEKLFTRGIDPRLQNQAGMADLEAAAARQRLAEENARDEAAHIEGIKALNKVYGCK
jgi:hypothetical protein